MRARRTLVLLAAAAAIAALPLALPLPRVGDDPFAGADGQAEAAILALHPDYRPWMDPLWKPPGPEIESLLFALQAALGAGVLGYYFGQRRGERRRDRGRDMRTADAAH